jgi:hypothetical protein
MVFGRADARLVATMRGKYATQGHHQPRIGPAGSSRRARAESEVAPVTSESTPPPGCWERSCSSGANRSLQPQKSQQLAPSHEVRRSKCRPAADEPPEPGSCLVVTRRSSPGATRGRRTTRTRQGPRRNPPLLDHSGRAAERLSEPRTFLSRRTLPTSRSTRRYRRDLQRRRSHRCSCRRRRSWLPGRPSRSWRERSTHRARGVVRRSGAPQVAHWSLRQGS